MADVKPRTPEEAGKCPAITGAANVQAVPARGSCPAIGVKSVGSSCAIDHRLLKGNDKRERETQWHWL